MSEDVTPEEKQQAQIALAHLTEKRDKSIEGQTVHNGKPTREWSSREESASPTASTEGTFLMAPMDAWEKRDAMSTDTPNTFYKGTTKWEERTSQSNDENCRSASGTADEKGTTHSQRIRGIVLKN